MIKYFKLSAIILLVFFVIKKVKTSMFQDMDRKMKALGFPVLAIVIGQYLLKKEEFAMPITIAGIIQFVAGVLEVTDSQKFKQEDLGLSGHETMLTQEFGSMDELHEYIKANTMQGQEYLEGEVNGLDGEEYLEGEILEGEVKQNTHVNDELYGNVRIHELGSVEEDILV